MAAAKLMYLGILLMLLGLAALSSVTPFIRMGIGGFEALRTLVYFGDALVAIGFVAGVFGLYRQAR